MNRSIDLPDYETPPLSEVVLGVQFEHPRGYQQIYAKDVWELFINDFPGVKEVDALPPSFETFGLPSAKIQKIELLAGATHDRFWFLSKDETELLQFQQDRLLHNWRKAQDGSNPYPRFENILPKFESELLKLKEYYSTKFSAKELEINQCELTYVNLITLPEPNQLLDKWIRIVNSTALKFDNISITTQKKLMRNDGEPYGRLICSCNNGFDQNMNSVIDLRLTVRGAPAKANIEEALRFLKDGRNAIVRCFDEITTDYAHSQWGKK